jgi:hypothetical protein
MHPVGLTVLKNSTVFMYDVCNWLCLERTCGTSLCQINTVSNTTKEVKETEHINNPRTQEFLLGVEGGSTKQLKTEGRENVDLGALAALVRVRSICKLMKTCILIRLLRMYFPRSWEFGSALSKCRNFGGGGGLIPPKPPNRGPPLPGTG